MYSDNNLEYENLICFNSISISKQYKIFDISIMRTLIIFILGRQCLMTESATWMEQYLIFNRRLQTLKRFRMTFRQSSLKTKLTT